MEYDRTLSIAHFEISIHLDLQEWEVGYVVNCAGVEQTSPKSGLNQLSEHMPM